MIMIGLNDQAIFEISSSTFNQLWSLEWRQLHSGLNYHKVDNLYSINWSIKILQDAGKKREVE